MDANEVLGIGTWALGLNWATGMAALWWLLGSNRDLEERVRRLEVDASTLDILARAIGEDAVYALAEPREEETP